MCVLENNIIIILDVLFHSIRKHYWRWQVNYATHNFHNFFDTSTSVKRKVHVVHLIWCGLYGYGIYLHSGKTALFYMHKLLLYEARTEMLPIWHFSWRIPIYLPTHPPWPACVERNPSPCSYGTVQTDHWRQHRCLCTCLSCLSLRLHRLGPHAPALTIQGPCLPNLHRTNTHNPHPILYAKHYPSEKKGIQI